MKKLIFLLFAFLPLMAAAQRTEFPLGVIEYDQTRIDFVNGLCTVNLRLNIPPHTFDRSGFAELKPVFRYGPKSQTGETVVLQGERGQGYGRVVNYKNGFSIDLPIELTYESGMEDGVLYVDYSTKRGGLSGKYKSLRLPIYIDQTPYLVFEAVKDANFHWFSGIQTGDTHNDALLERADNSEDDLERMGMTDQVLMTYPDNFMLHNNLAICYLRRDNHELAMKELKRAIELNPESKEVAANLSLLCLLDKKMTDAQLYMAMAKDAPTYNEVYGNLSILEGRAARATGLMAGMTTNSAILAHIINQEYRTAHELLEKKGNKDGMTYYLQAILGHRTDNEPMLIEGLRYLRAKDSRLYLKAAKSREFENCKHLFKGI